MQIFVISLQRSAQRREQMQQRLDCLGLEFKFWDGVDGKDPAQLGQFQSYYSYWRAQCKYATPLKDTEIGCFASHFSLWQQVVVSGQAALILEDDVTFSADFLAKWPTICQLGQQYGYLRLGGNYADRPYFWEKDGVRSLSSPPYSAFAYILTPGAARQLIAQAKHWDQIVDSYLDSYWLHGVPIITLYPYVADQDRNPANSTIGYATAPTVRWYYKIPREVYRVYAKFLKARVDAKLKQGKRC